MPGECLTLCGFMALVLYVSCVSYRRKDTSVLVFLALSKVTILLRAPPGLALLVRMLCQSPPGILFGHPAEQSGVSVERGSSMWPSGDSGFLNLGTLWKRQNWLRWYFSLISIVTKHPGPKMT